MKTKKVHFRLLVVLFLTVFISCNGDKHSKMISSKYGITWVEVSSDSANYTYAYGYTFYSSNVGFKVIYDKQSQKETPIMMNCFDCADSWQNMRQLLFDWKLVSKRMIISNKNAADTYFIKELNDTKISWYYINKGDTVFKNYTKVK